MNDEMLKSAPGVIRRNRQPEYYSWCSMKVRCEDPTSEKYPHYGGRGIAVCARWRASFDAFLEDMGPRPKGTTIDRINNDGDYEPGNCRWATAEMQRQNRPDNIILTVNGTSAPMAEWARQHGIPLSTVRWRIAQGWEPAYALTAPPHARRQRRADAEAIR